MKFNISEIFLSIQGEGPESGQEVIFIRFSGCNLRCRWGSEICDTPYTSWEPEKKLIELPALLSSVEEIGGICRKIVITGGEPTIQPHLKALCSALRELGYSISIETNGRGAVPTEIATVVCSPKLSDSTPRGSKYETRHESERVILHPDIAGSDKRVFLKFVVGESTPESEIREIIIERDFPPERVYLMPLGTTVEGLDNNLNFAEAMAASLGCCISDRAHIRSWGNVRGR